MKKIALLGGLLLSALSFADGVLNLDLTPYFFYQESNYSCHHSDHTVAEFRLVGDVVGGKLVRAFLYGKDWANDVAVELSQTELAGSPVMTDYAGTLWLSKLRLSPQTLNWLFDHLYDEVVGHRCPSFNPIQLSALDLAPAEFTFLVVSPVQIRYAAPIVLHGTRGYETTSFEISQFGLRTEPHSN